MRKPDTRMATRQFIKIPAHRKLPRIVQDDEAMKRKAPPPFELDKGSELQYRDILREVGRTLTPAERWKAASTAELQQLARTKRCNPEDMRALQRQRQQLGLSPWRLS